MEEDQRKAKKGFSKIIIFVILLLVMIDQASKMYIINSKIVSEDNISINAIKNVLDITYVENRGRSIWNGTK